VVAPSEPLEHDDTMTNPRATTPTAIQRGFRLSSLAAPVLANPLVIVPVLLLLTVPPGSRHAVRRKAPISGADFLIVFNK
jgi:hypothetical protein